MINQDFETRLKELHKSMGSATVEVGAAVNIYERLVTAKSIGISVFGKDVPASVVSVILAELSDETRLLFDSDRRLFEE